MLIEAERGARANADKAARDLKRQLESTAESMRQGEIAAAERAGRLEGEAAALKDQVHALDEALARALKELSAAQESLKQESRERTPAGPRSASTKKAAKKQQT